MGKAEIWSKIEGPVQRLLSPGAKCFKPAYGGVTLITGWDPSQTYDLSAWPTPPTVTRTGDRVRVRCGLSIVEITGVADGADLDAQLIWAAPG